MVGGLSKLGVQRVQSGRAQARRMRNVHQANQRRSEGEEEVRICISYLCLSSPANLSFEYGLIAPCIRTCINPTCGLSHSFARFRERQKAEKRRKRMDEWTKELREKSGKQYRSAKNLMRATHLSELSAILATKHFTENGSRSQVFTDLRRSTAFWSCPPGSWPRSKISRVPTNGLNSPALPVFEKSFSMFYFGLYQGPRHKMVQRTGHLCQNPLTKPLACLCSDCPSCGTLTNTPTTPKRPARSSWRSKQPTSSWRRASKR